MFQITTNSLAIISNEPPVYGQRTNFRPKAPEDFGDGGAFPEIHFAQFPLGKIFTKFE